MSISTHTIVPINSVKRFFFLDYFHVLLKSVKRHSNEANAFGMFLQLKDELRLGESKYKTLSEREELTGPRVQRYIFTFNEVVNEAMGYNLVKRNRADSLSLTPLGSALLGHYRNEGPDVFNMKLLPLMERRYGAFRFLVDLLYSANSHRQGLLVLPSYSPRQLQMEPGTIRTASDIARYSRLLKDRLEEDARTLLGQHLDLTAENGSILKQLHSDGLLPKQGHDGRFEPKQYNAIIKRFRNHWITYFLKNIYKFPYSQSSFDIWTYRAKQLGILNVTEFYPKFFGRMVYPTSILCPTTASPDFREILRYDDGRGLYIHEPRGDENENAFVDSLWTAYVELRRTTRGYFVNLLSLRELVCYDMKISEQFFRKLLERTYKLNLEGKLQIKISLEVDRLPEETQAHYLTQEPVMIDGQYRNIISISKEQH